jgi:hypothetical protein
MKYLMAAIVLVLLSGSAHALELSKTITHQGGWVFDYQTKINGKFYPIEIPLNKCDKEDVKKNCFTKEERAHRVAYGKAKSAEKMMREALKGK